MKSSLLKPGLLLLIGGLIVFNYSGASAEERYMCFPDFVTGFKYSERTGKWVETSFGTERKYIVSESDDEKYPLKVTIAGQDSLLCLCGGFDQYGSLSCYGAGREFKFNKKNKRYLCAYPSGYYNVVPDGVFSSDEKSDTPYIEIGRCVSF